MIETHSLTKTFTIKNSADITAVQDLTLSIPEGEVFGFLGPNGAGKTTTVRMLTSLIAPTSGTARVNGFEIGVQDQDVRRSVGILTESPGLYERLSAHRNLSIYANLYDVADAEGQVSKYLHLLGIATPVSAQTEDYRVHLRRNFGYGGGANIRGDFTISLVGDEANVAEVVFLIDGETMATALEAPFNFRFDTDDYGLVTHRLWAEYTLLDGASGTTAVIQYNFVSPEAQREQMTTILLAIGGALFAVIVVVALIQGTLFKKKGNRHEPGEPRQYGMMGGTVCPKCGRPFPRHIWGINLVMGRLDRCENCGKWVMTTRATPAELAAAEARERAELAADEDVTAAAGPDRDQLLADSRYVDDV